MNDGLLRQRAHRAFVRGRLREALLMMLVAGLVVLGASLLVTQVTQTVGLGALLLVVIGVFSFRGGEAGNVIMPALILGLMPLSCSLAARHFGHLCTGSACVSLCIPICTAGGLAAGAVLVRFAREHARPARTWWFGAIIVAVAGSLGCACVGLSGVSGMVLGLLVPRLFAARAW
jgi:hypothetical protein